MKHLLKIGIAILLGGQAGVLFAETPQWWIDRRVVDTNTPPNDYAPVNQGQAKHVATQAKLEFQQKLGFVEPDIVALVSGFSETNNFLPMNLGQLKYLAVPFYNQLDHLEATNAWPTNMTVGPHPWSGSVVETNDYALANIGQLKYLFSFDLYTVDTDRDGLPDWWEILYFGDATSAVAISDSDEDGLTNLQEYVAGSNPWKTDSDEDGLPDGFEVDHGLDPNNPADALLDLDGDGLSNLDEYLNGTNPALSDSDGDGLFDRDEILFGSDPNAIPTNSVLGRVWIDSGSTPAGAFKIDLSFDTNELALVSVGGVGEMAPNEYSIGQYTEYLSGNTCITYMQSLSIANPTGSNALVNLLFQKVYPEAGHSSVLISVGTVLKNAADGSNATHNAWMTFTDLSEIL